MTQKNKAGSMILGVAFVWFTTHFGGGFASGAVLPDKDAVNKAVARFNQTQCQLLENIKGLIGKLNTTVEKSGKV